MIEITNMNEDLVKGVLHMTIKKQLQSIHEYK